MSAPRLPSDDVPATARDTWPAHLTSLTGAFGKSLATEIELERLNDLLAPVEQQLERSQIAPTHPTVFILGPPRAGTTLISQLLAGAGGFGWISNFAARFWRAPALGCAIASTVGPFADGVSNFTSVRGRTQNWDEPNEFGYFWSHWFDRDQQTHLVTPDALAQIDQVALRRAIAAIEAVWDRPLMFKNNTWFTFQAHWLASVFPKSVFVVCRRDAFFVAQSLLIQRRDLYGDDARWWSVRPPNYAELLRLPPFEQVAWQAVSIEHAMERSLCNVDDARVVTLPYPALCDEPHAALHRLAESCRHFGTEPKLMLDRVPARFACSDESRLPPNETNAIRRAVDAARSQLQKPPTS